MTGVPLSGLPQGQRAEIEAQLNVLREFNRKVDRLETTGFWRRYENEVPNVVVKMDDLTMEKTGIATFSMLARIHSWIPEFDQDEIDAFVLTFRLFTQDNDRISLRSLSRIYASEWLKGGNAQECFEGARKQLNDHLDSTATVIFGDTAVSIRFIADVVIYGGLAHTNEEKSKIFQNWSESGIMGLIWAEFFAYGREGVDTLKYLRGLNAGLLEGIEKHGFTMIISGSDGKSPATAN
ncbi:hypothetical protein [Bradyrhizobium sp. NBAIM01]|uniref:hypothetical protein n=1 Tax=Bradyrhizobium sp. NBAIM01 TaxID=2793818 RepID=UPI001CD786BD|nr:hypothetical protein [Bradyrhizobium sp. NBAIM01]MCA1510454.1 hypothetical protein [Bradyrhizobium sp. NBAIM01]